MKVMYLSMVSLLVFGLNTAFADSAPPTLTLEGQGLVCRVASYQTFDPTGTPQTQYYLTATTGYTYADSQVSLTGNTLSISVAAGFYSCGYATGDEGAWSAMSPASWDHFTLGFTDDIQSSTIATAEYVPADDQTYTASVSVPMDKVLDTATMALYQSGQAVSGTLFVGNSEGSWNSPGGIFMLTFSVDPTTGFATSDLSFYSASDLTH